MDYLKDIRYFINFSGNIYNQDLNLDKANIKSGYGFNFTTSIMF